MKARRMGVCGRPRGWPRQTPGRGAESKQPGLPPPSEEAPGSPRARGARGAGRLPPPRGAGWQRPSRSCQGHTFTFPGGTWSGLACRPSEYLLSVILRRCHSRREKAELSSWGSWQLSLTCRPPPPPLGCQKDLCSLLISCFFLFRKGCAPSPENWVRPVSQSKPVLWFPGTQHHHFQNFKIWWNPVGSLEFSKPFWLTLLY